MLISLKSVSELVWVSLDVDSDVGIGVVIGMVAMTGLDKKLISLYISIKNSSHFGAAFYIASYGIPYGFWCGNVLLSN